MKQKTFTGKFIEVVQGRKPLSPVERKIYNVIRRSPHPRTERQLQRISALDDIGDIGRTLRKLRESGWLRSNGKPPKYEVII